MADRPFPWASELDAQVRHLIQQPVDSRWQPTWEEEEFFRVYNDVYEELHQEVADIDRHYTEKYTDISVAAGTQIVTLAADTRFVRKIRVINDSGDIRENVDASTGEEMGTGYRGEKALYQPDDNTIRFERPPGSAITIRVHYGAYWIPLIHGCVVTSSLVATQIDSWHSIDNDEYNGLEIATYASDDPLYNAVRQTSVAALSGYNGVTRTLVPSPSWTTTPASGDKITSRPNLPREMRNAWIRMSAAKLFEKTDDNQASKFFQLAERAVKKAKISLKLRDRQEILPTIDTNGLGGWTDPADVLPGA